MIRVIAGDFGRINLDGPSDNKIRPTMDRSKEGLFNVINMNINDAKFLDLFAGTGSIGIEALSRGASEVCFVDSSNDAIKLINGNLSKVKQEAKVIKAEALDFVNRATGEFDYIFLDPPYDMKIEDIEKIIVACIENNLLAENGEIIFEYNTKKGIEIEGVELFKFKKYGISGFSFYKEIDA